MGTVARIVSSVNVKRRPGRPRLRTLVKEREIIRRFVKAAITTGSLSSDEELGQAVGLVVTDPKRALSQVLPTLISEVRPVRRQAGHPCPEQVDVIVDRGA